MFCRYYEILIKRNLFLILIFNKNAKGNTPMKTITGTINSDLIIKNLTDIRGSVNGDIEVIENASLVVKGSVNGDITNNIGCRVEILGSVNGAVHNKGKLYVYGYIDVLEESTGELFVLDDGVIGKIT